MKFYQLFWCALALASATGIAFIVKSLVEPPFLSWALSVIAFAVAFSIVAFVGGMCVVSGRGEHD
jgi:hypothetical protein